MKEMSLNPKALQTVNSVRNQSFVDAIAVDMKSNGWQGRRILVELVRRFENHTDAYAWTGSHRIAAAVMAGLLTVPCLVIEAAEAKRIFEAKYPMNGYSSYRNALAWYLGGGDKQKLEALNIVGLEDAAALMRQEIEENEKPSKRYDN